MILLFASFAVLSAEPAAPAVPVPTATPAEAAPKAKVKKVCRKIENSNSRMSKRVCTTDPDYDKQQEGVNAADLQRMGGR